MFKSLYTVPGDIHSDMGAVAEPVQSEKSMAYVLVISLLLREIRPHLIILQQEKQHH